MSAKFLLEIQKTFEKYFQYGARSSQKVNYFHNYIKGEIDEYLVQNQLTDRYKCCLEVDVKSTNSTGKKKCDIVIIRTEIDGSSAFVPFIVFPVKIIMTNYKQNKNNSWENLTGELQHLKWANGSALKIIPINVITNKVPYLNAQKKITKFEEITYDGDFQIYNELKSHDIADELMNYILDVEHNCVVNGDYDTCPLFVSFNSKTEFVGMDDVLRRFLV